MSTQTQIDPRDPVATAVADADVNHGRLLYQYDGELTGFTEYGASIADLLSGEAEPPASGLRVDIRFAADVTGPLPGRIEGTDYLNVRADGRMELDIKATLVTEDGARIAVSAGGVAIPRPGSTASVLRENVKLTTAHPDYLWVNNLQIWAVGEGDVSTGRLAVRGYIPA